MSEAQESGLQLSKLHKLITRNRFTDLDSLWPDVVEVRDHTYQDLLALAGLVNRRGHPDRALDMAMLVLVRTEEQAGVRAALAAARLAISENIVGTELDTELVRLYGQVFTDYEDLPALIERVSNDGPTLLEFAGLIDLYMNLQPGTFVQGQVSLDPGQVVEVDSGRAVVSVNFDGRRYDFGIDKVSELRPLPEDHFPSLVLYKPESMRARVSEHPVDFVMLALQSASDNRIDYRELKLRVSHLLGDSGWTAWWKKAKPALKRAPLIELSSGSQPRFRLLDEEKSYEDRLQHRFKFIKRPIAKLKVATDYLDETDGRSGYEADDELLVFFGNGAARIAVDAFSSDPALALIGLAVHDEVAQRGVAVAKPNSRAATAVLAKLDEPGQLTKRLPEAFIHRVLDYLRRSLDDWPAFWFSILHGAGKRLCDKIARVMIEEGRTDTLSRILVDIVARPTGSPDVVCWLWRARQTGNVGRALADVPGLSTSEILRSLVILADSVGRLYGVSGEERHHKILESVQNALASKKSEQAREALEAIDRNTTIDFKNIIENNNGLTGELRGMFLGILRGRFEDLFVEETRPWEEDAIYTTKDGLAMRQQELEEIIREDIPEVAIQIGEAASFGDLSENAEYTAALEKRDQLTSRATRIENELKMAEVISQEMVDSDYVNIGTRVTARNVADDAEEIYTFLGPWDSEPERRILTYNAPLSLAFMGGHVGDDVSYGEGADRLEWVILSIEPGI